MPNSTHRGSHFASTGSAFFRKYATPGTHAQILVTGAEVPQDSRSSMMTRATGELQGLPGRAVTQIPGLCTKNADPEAGTGSCPSRGNNHHDPASQDHQPTLLAEASISIKSLTPDCPSIRAPGLGGCSHPGHLCPRVPFPGPPPSAQHPQPQRRELPVDGRCAGAVLGPRS